MHDHARPTSSLTQAFLALHPRKVLLAEDDHELRHLIASALRRDGYQVVEAATGRDLLRHIASTVLQDASARADVIVSDIRMPGFSGLDILAGLRANGWQVPVVLITAFGDRETHAEAMRLGANAVFDKPFDLDDLRTVVLNVGDASPSP